MQFLTIFLRMDESVARAERHIHVARALLAARRRAWARAYAPKTPGAESSAGPLSPRAEAAVCRANAREPPFRALSLLECSLADLAVLCDIVRRRRVARRSERRAARTRLAALRTDYELACAEMAPAPAQDPDPDPDPVPARAPAPAPTSTSAPPTASPLAVPPHPARLVATVRTAFCAHACTSAHVRARIGAASALYLGACMVIRREIGYLALNF